MNQFTADYRHLDAATSEYLASVSAKKGMGSPGVFVAGRVNAWPVLSLIAGIAILIVGSLFALSSGKAPWAAALLFTAAVLLGGWMILYPFRRWFGGGLGNFTYFDPLHAFQSNGTEVTVTNVAETTNLEMTENYSNGTYTNTTLLFKRPGGDFKINIPGQARAEFIANYYGNLLAFADDPAMQNKSPIERGCTALHVAREKDFPSDPKLLDLTLQSLPEEPAAAKTTRGAGLRYAVIIAAAAAIFCGGWALIGPVQDEMAFQEASKHGVHGYRDYLWNERNTRHRDEAKARLKELYQPAIAKADGCPDEAEKKAWTTMLTELSGFEGPPVVSLGVTEDNLPTPKPGDALAREQQMKTWLADSLGSHFGPDFVGFVQPPEGAKPLLEVKYTNTAQTMTWQFLFRSTPDAEPVAGPVHTVDVFTANAILGGFPSPKFQEAFFKQSFNVLPPVIFTAPTGGGDFGE